MVKKIKYLILSFFFIISVSFVNAAELYFNPSSFNASVGDTIRVSLRVSSDQSINAVSAGIDYPRNLLQLTSISKADSIISLWPSEPSYSNQTGTAKVEGVVLNPGFSGVGGRVVTMSFKVREEGKATISFLNSSVLANDGQGTNILKTTPSITIDIAKALTPTEPQEKPVDEAEKEISTSSEEIVPAVVAPEVVPEVISKNKGAFDIESVRTFLENYKGIGYEIISYLAISIILISLIFTLIAVFWYGIIILVRLRNKFWSEVAGANHAVKMLIIDVHKSSVSHISKLDHLAKNKSVTSKQKELLKEVSRKLKEIEIVTSSKVGQAKQVEEEK